jgi:hypothetical protein
LAAKRPGSETPDVHPTKNTIRKGPAPGWRGGAPLYPLRWIRIGRESSRWAAKRPASETPCVPHREHHPAKSCPEGTFLDSPGFVRSTTLGYEAISHFSPERAGLTEAAGMNRGLKSTSIVRVRSPTIGPVPATAASSEPLQGSGVSTDVPHLGWPLRVNPRLWKISPSGNGLGGCRAEADPVVPFGSMNSLGPRPRRTSVSAPLGWDRKRIVPTGSQKTWIGNPIYAQPRTPSGQAMS